MTVSNQAASSASMTVPGVGQKRLVIVGATGMVGGYALRYALDNSAVRSVTSIWAREARHLALRASRGSASRLRRLLRPCGYTLGSRCSGMPGHVYRVGVGRGAPQGSDSKNLFSKENLQGFQKLLCGRPRNSLNYKGCIQSELAFQKEMILVRRAYSVEVTAPPCCQNHLKLWTQEGLPAPRSRTSGVTERRPRPNFPEARFGGPFLGRVCKQPAATRFATRQLAQVEIGGPQWPDYSARRACTGFTDAARCAGI